MDNEKSLAEILLNHEVESEELASKWIEHLTSEEREVIESPSELERYKNNIYESIKRFARKY
ncbi:MAG: hypothetical protein AABX83_02980 [Nanoarchaeota archaeon]